MISMIVENVLIKIEEKCVEKKKKIEKFLFAAKSTSVNV